MAKTYALSYGFLQGRPHSVAFCKKLEQAGFVPAKNILSADVVIAHSAGCLTLPLSDKPQTILLTGAPLPHKNSTAALLNASRQTFADFRAHGRTGLAFKIIFLNLLCGTAHPMRNYGKARAVTSRRTPDCNPSSRVIFIANQQDPWPTGETLGQLLIEKPWTFISLRGSHDHIWQEPQLYIDILRRFI